MKPIIKKSDLLKYKMDSDIVKNITGVKADLYVFTVDQLNEFLENREKATISGSGLLKWLQNESNILTNTASLMWNNPDEQQKTKEVANHLDKTIQYIKLSKITFKNKNI